MKCAFGLDNTGTRSWESVGGRQVPGRGTLKRQLIHGRGHSHRAHTFKNDNIPFTAAGTPAQSTKKLIDFLKSPFDIATFGPRLAVGTALSAQEIASNLQKDVQKASTLLQGPRPALEKQDILSQEIESRLADYLQKGAAAEAEVLSAVAALLPEDVKQNLPKEMKDVFLRGSIDKRVPPTAPTRAEAQSIPIAAVTKTQTEAEVDDIKEAVVSLRTVILELTNNTDPAQSGVLKINVIDARNTLSRRLDQLSPAASSVQGANLRAAETEARLLLRDAEALQL